MTRCMSLIAVPLYLLLPCWSKTVYIGQVSVEVKLNMATKLMFADKLQRVN